MAAYKVLLADDDEGMLAYLKRNLERAGHEVRAVDDGRKAEAALQNGTFDLVVTDMNMPNRSGLKVLEKALEVDPNLPVIIVTGEGTLGNSVEALNKGAFGYLTKPFNHISVLTTTVERALDFRKAKLDNIAMAEAQRKRGDLLEHDLAARGEEFRLRAEVYRSIVYQLPLAVFMSERDGFLGITDLARALLSGKTALETEIALRDVTTKEGEREQTVSIEGMPMRAKAIAMRSDKRQWLVILTEQNPQGDQTTKQNGAGPALTGMAAPLKNIENDVAQLLEKIDDPEQQRIVEAIADELTTIERAVLGGNSLAAKK